MTSLRSIIGRFELDDLLAHRETVNDELRSIFPIPVELLGAVQSIADRTR